MRYALFLFVFLSLLPAVSPAQDLPVIDGPESLDTLSMPLPEQEVVTTMVANFIKENNPNLPTEVKTFNQKCQISEVLVVVEHHPREDLQFAEGWDDLVHVAVRKNLGWSSLQLKVRSRSDLDQPLWQPEISTMMAFCLGQIEEAKK